jgi:tetratricopeptide (TPR) repeat protein
MAKIYISSTFEDLKDYRAAAYHRLNEMRHDVISMEDYTAGDQRPLDKCLADVAACDIYIGIFAWRYGYIPGKDNPDRKSITELEYRKATQLRKPALIFLLSEDATWQPRWMDFRSGDGDRGARIEALRQELKTEHTVCFFSSPDGLSGDVSVAVNRVQQEWIAEGIAEHRREMAQESERRRNRLGQHIVGQHILDLGASFKGRVEEQKELGTWLAEPATRLVSIVGRPGIGKTALASKVLGELEHNSWPPARDSSGQNDSSVTVNGIIYLSTRTSGVNLETLFTNCATMLGGEREDTLHRTWASSQLSVSEKIERLLQALDDGIYVILMDHMEDLLDDKGAITDPDLSAFFDLSLAVQRGARLVVTSRAPIAFHPERMRFDKRIPLATGLSVADGIALLRDMDPNGLWGLRDFPEEQLARAVRRLYGIPRALELLAGLLKDQLFSSPDEILNQFGDDVVGALMQEAYSRLGSPERRVMEALAVLGRPVPLVAVQFMVASFEPGLSVDAILRRLIDVHTVTLDRQSRTVALNPIDQDYVYRRLAVDGEYGRNALDNRAADYYAQLRIPKDRWQSAVDLGPYLLEFDHRFRAGQYEAAAEVLDLIDVEFAAWRTYTRRLQAMHQSLEGKLQDRRLEMIRVYSIAQTYIFLGPLEKAAEHFESVRATAHDIGNLEFERKATAWIGEAARRLGHLDQAVEYLSRAVAMDSADSAPQDTFLMNLGFAHCYKGEFRQAVACGQRLLELGARHADPVLTAQAHDVLSLAHFALRNFEEALTHSRTAVDLYRSADARDPLAYVLNVEGMIYVGLGRLDDAVTALEQAAFRAKEDDSPRVEGFCLLNLARAYRMKNDAKLALERATSAASVLSRLGAPEAAAASAFIEVLRASSLSDKTALARALLGYAQSCAATGDLLPPDDVLREADAIARAEGHSA